MEPAVQPVYEITVTRRKISDVQFHLGQRPSDYIPRIGDLVRIVRPFFDGLDHERLLAIYFNPGGEMTGLQVIAEGGRTSVECEPVTLLRAAIMADAAAVVLVHNHPFGTVDPSDSDRELTNAHQQALGMFNILFADAIIVTDDAYYSKRENVEQERHEAILKGQYVPRPEDYNLFDPVQRAKCASDLRLCAGMQTDPNLKQAMNVTAATIEGKMDPVDALMKISALEMRSRMGFDPDGEDGPTRLN